MKCLKINILLLFFVIQSFANSNLPNGSPCYLKNGTSGICVEISGCPSIRNLLSKGVISRIHVTVCNKSKRFLCCPLPPPEEETTIKPVFTNAIQKNRISERSNIYII